MSDVTPSEPDSTPGVRHQASSLWDRRLGFWWIAEDHPDSPAIVESPDGPRTYGELAGDAHQLVHLFRSLGANTGDAVAVIADNGNTLIETSLASQEGGFHFIPLNTHLTVHELAAIMEHSAAKVLVIGERFAPLLAGLDATALGLTVLAVGHIDGILSLGEARTAHPRTEPDDRSPGGLFVYTSGTTGKPKGIRRPNPVGDIGQVANDAALFGRAFDFRPFDGPMLVSTGMFHGGSHSYYMGGLHVGHPLVVMAKFDPERTLQLIEQHRVRTGYMVPTQFHRLLQLPLEVRDRYDVSSLHSIVHSAAPCPRPVKEQMMAWWGPVIWETYGGMEGAATIAKPHRWLEKPGTVGRAIKGMRLAILDDDGNELPAGQVGHIYLDNGVGFSYHGDAEQTESAFKGNRFSLGDMGYLDADGYLFISDRAKDMIITGGTNVYPAEIEAVLLEHPKVHDAGVIGIPDPDWGETVTALVQVKAGVEPDANLQTELTAFCKDRLASYKVPRRWDFRDDLPRTEAGKLYKRKIRDEYIAALEETS
jgi:long-chain acyl-CoA synthetase